MPRPALLYSLPTICHPLSTASLLPRLLLLLREPCCPRRLRAHLNPTISPSRQHFLDFLETAPLVSRVRQSDAHLHQPLWFRLPLTHITCPQILPWQTQSTQCYANFTVHPSSIPKLVHGSFFNTNFQCFSLPPAHVCLLCWFLMYIWWLSRLTRLLHLTSVHLPTTEEKWSRE